MRKDEVPQQKGILENWKEVVYALDDEGNYTTVQSEGWEVKDAVNAVARRVIDQQVAAALEKIRLGKASPLLYYAARHQISGGALAQHVGLPRWRVWWHLKPRGFARMSEKDRQAYQELLDISDADFGKLPEE